MSRHFPLAEEPSSAISAPIKIRKTKNWRSKSSRTLPNLPDTRVSTHTDEGYWRSSTLRTHNIESNIPEFNRVGLKDSINLAKDEADLVFSEEKEDLELGLSLDLDNPLRDQGEPSYSLQDDSDEDEMFSGDKDVKIAELRLMCAKMKKRYVSEKQTGTQLQQRVRDLKLTLENERKKYRRLEKNFSMKEQQILIAVEETTDLEKKLRKVSIEELNVVRKFKKEVIIPEDLKEFKVELRKVHGNKMKLRELAIKIFEKYIDIKEKSNSLKSSNAETRKKYNKLLYDCHELGRWKEDMQKKYDLVKAQLEAMTNDMEEAIGMKLKPAQIEIECLKKELNEIRDHSQNQISLLRKRNTQLRTTFNNLQNQKNVAEDALQKQRTQTKVMADNLWLYKSQVEEHELTIRRWKCSLKKNIAYSSKPTKNQQPKVSNFENKDEPDTIDITLRVFKIPATGKLNIEISSDSPKIGFPDLRRGLSEVKAVRQLFSENGELSDLLSIILGDQELLIQSWQAKDIGEQLKAVIDVNNEVYKPESKVSPSERANFSGKKLSFFMRNKETQTHADLRSASLPDRLQQAQEACCSSLRRSRGEVPVSVHLSNFFFPQKENTSEKE